MNYRNKNAKDFKVGQRVVCVTPYQWCHKGEYTIKHIDEDGFVQVQERGPHHFAYRFKAAEPPKPYREENGYTEELVE